MGYKLPKNPLTFLDYIKNDLVEGHNAYKMLEDASKSGNLMNPAIRTEMANRAARKVWEENFFDEDALDEFVNLHYNADNRCKDSNDYAKCIEDLFNNFNFKDEGYTLDPSVILNPSGKAVEADPQMYTDHPGKKIKAKANKLINGED